jgi:AmiR/NasT family two-component response regulator
MTDSDADPSLQSAFASSRDIAAATGLLIARYGLTHHDAFAALRRLSERLHQPLHEVALRVLETGAVPTAAAFIPQPGCGDNR